MSATLTSTTSTEQPLPLTTVFSPPSECLTDLWVLQSQFRKRTSHWGHLGPADPRRCLPSGWSSDSYFSPGNACPSGWKSNGYEVRGDETTATCCPIYEKSSWTFTPRGSATVDRPWHSFEICDYGINSTVTYTALNTNENGLSTETTTRLQTPGQSWNAYGIELRWRATDPRPVPATSTTSGDATQTASPSKGKSPSGLSTGAKAGIGVGVGVGGLLIILALGFLILRRRKHGQDNTKSPTNRLFNIQELSGVGTSKGKPHELNADSNLHEVGAKSTVEKNGSDQAPLRDPVELDGSGTR
ncbi:uncharacterized protein N7469_008728 [Penicillium citrinum]|uniref:Uncharacterized protein n=1 Tax=Penicillium citrinum TaxID=5077 RepID=A0A9W9NPJ9_PENCI|nr:uncharacterized protein N7469_008728 [Penicillium citrinum]KAJ5222488.1 hypothetical protein N7469_008728 [Penicillium citrinum]